MLEDPAPLLYHDEPIWRDGNRVGRVSSGAHGHTLGRAVALGWLEDAAGIDAAYVEGGRFEIEVALVRHAARASMTPFFDPAGKRQRG
jgi:4-methylaminobutanoate oxidase (formaldehyde-forming)